MKITDTSKHPSPEWLFGGNPDAIERQETEGQIELVLSSQLPLRVNSPGGIDAITQYKKMGMGIIGQDEDPLFVEVRLPTGWSIDPTKHSMWSNLIDDKKRKRASIFYKAAFYDRDAFINFKRRYTFEVDRIGFINGDYSQRKDGTYVFDSTPFAGVVFDCDQERIFTTGHVKCDITRTPDGNYTKTYCEQSDEITAKLKKECIEFLEKNHPGYEDINAHWD